MNNAYLEFEAFLNYYVVASTFFYIQYLKT